MMDRAATGASLTLKVHPHVLRHACGFALANAGHDTRALQAYLGHRNIQHTVRYTELAPDQFKTFWKNRAPPVLNPLESQCRPSSSATQAHLGNEHRSIPRHPVDWRLQRGGADHGQDINPTSRARTDTMKRGPESILPQSLAPRGLSREQAAAYVGVSPSLFDTLVKDGRMPAPKRINARTVWDRLQLDAAFAALPSNDAPVNPWDEMAA
jgi:predicted DNA-binding transcriptional regulator AlpA